MGFMQRDIRHGRWWQGEGKDGGTYYAPTDVLSVRDFILSVLGYDGGDLVGYSNAELTAGDGGFVQVVRGYGARLSAPGYLDCTEWCVFATEAEAEAYLSEVYGDDEAEGEGDDTPEGWDAADTTHD